MLNTGMSAGAEMAISWLCSCGSHILAWFVVSFHGTQAASCPIVNSALMKGSRRLRLAWGSSRLQASLLSAKPGAKISPSALDEQRASRAD